MRIEEAFNIPGAATTTTESAETLNTPPTESSLARTDGLFVFTFGLAEKFKGGSADDMQNLFKRGENENMNEFRDACKEIHKEGDWEKWSQKE